VAKCLCDVLPEFGRKDMAQEMVFARERRGNEIDALEVLRTILRRRKLIALVALAFTLAAAVLAFLLPPTYVADVSLLISTNDQNSQLQSLSRLAAQYGMLGSALVPDEASNRRAESLATLQSRVLTEDYIKDKNLLPILFASKWDSTKQEWKDKDVADQPTLWDASQLFAKRIRTVTEDRRTGLITLSISWEDGQRAAEWANDLVARTNAYLRKKSMDQSAQNLAYLNEELERTNTIEIKQAVYSLIETEIKKTMLARGNDQFAFNVIDPAVAPRDQSTRQRVIAVVLGCVVGIFLGIALSFAIEWTRNSRIKRV
jgi:uncharacterized protein involved in exopolysaccharide biosynthesis